MNLPLLFPFFFSALFSAGCNRGTDAPPAGPYPQGPTDSTLVGGNLPPVETKTANSNYKPAFAGQTRAAGMKTQQALDVQVLSSGLQSPWGIIVLPDARLLITEKGGTLRIASPEGVLSAPITGLPAVNASGQGGLLDVVADPDFAQNGMIYWTFSEATTGGNLTAVAKGKLDAAAGKVGNAQVIYRAIPAYKGTLHYGGRILFDPQGYLFVSTGERSDLATRPLAQDLSTALGKVLRIDKAGAAAPGNPFAGQTGKLPEIWSWGHRNVQGLALHPATNELWEGEFGPRGGDEVNHIAAGKNYGWPTITYGLEYAGPQVGAGITQQAGLEQPMYYWDPVVSPSGMIFHTGKGIAEWKNNLFLACLSGQHIARLALSGDKVVGEERLLEDKGERFRDVAEGPNGELYAVTDGGKLYRVK